MMKKGRRGGQTWSCTICNKTEHIERNVYSFQKQREEKGVPIFSDDGFLKSSLLSTSCHDVAVAL